MRRWSLFILFMLMFMNLGFARCLEYSNPNYLVIDSSAGIFVQLSVKVDVYNSCNKVVTGFATFKALKDGFSLYTKPVSFKIGPNENKTVTDEWYLKKNLYDKMDDVQFVNYHFEKLYLIK